MSPETPPSPAPTTPAAVGGPPTSAATAQGSGPGGTEGAGGVPVAPRPTAAAPEKRRRGRPKGSTARTTRVVEITLTVSGTADGEWQAELKRGTSWLARGLPVTANAVARAAAELHAEIAGPIDEIIGEARALREARVAELEAQLEQARKALAELE